MQRADLRGFVLGIGAGFAASLAAISPAFAEGPPPPYPTSWLAPKEPPKGVVFQAADALGMVRGLGENVFDAVNRIEFKFQGIASAPVH